MARRDESLMELLADLPWWVSVCFAAVVYMLLKFVVPSIAFSGTALKLLASTTPQYAWIAVIFLGPGLLSAMRSLQKGRRLDGQTGIESIRDLPWKEFEELLGEAFRRRGYAVQENRHAGPDGGIDLVLTRNGDTYLVQAKQWRNAKVGVQVVREMLGVVTAQRAAGAIIVTSGMFTQEAQRFADGQPIDLIAGGQLAKMVRSAQKAGSIPRKVTRRPPEDFAAPAVENASPRACPLCGGQLVLRTAKRGPQAGWQFWGCANFPRCKHTERYEV